VNDCWLSQLILVTGLVELGGRAIPWDGVERGRLRSPIGENK